MTRNRRSSPEVRAQMFDVQLLDLFSEIESLLRSGREIQGDALRMRRVAPTNGVQRRAAAAQMQRRVDQLRRECRVLCDVARALVAPAARLRTAADNRHHRRRDDNREKGRRRANVGA